MYGVDHQGEKDTEGGGARGEDLQPRLGLSDPPGPIEYTNTRGETITCGGRMLAGSSDPSASLWFLESASASSCLGPGR